MGKAPAFQFYVKDWLTDPQLRMCSHTTKGIWIDLLCLMWEAPEKGKLEGSVEQLSRMVAASNGDFEQFLEEAQSTNFATVTLHNKKVTIINRRMQREERERESHRKRQDRYRQRHRGDAGDGQSDAPVTVPSSSPSSSSSSKHKSTVVPATPGTAASPQFADGDPPLELARIFLNLIQARDPKAKADLKAWAMEIDRMIRLDARDPPEIERLIRWCQEDPFEQNNVLSPKKLRQRYTGLLGKMIAGPRRREFTPGQI
jgi:hypothetical protein